MSESIEFDLLVNGKPAVKSINEVEKAQEELDKTVDKTSKNIKANWTAIGASAAAITVAMGALMKGALDLEKSMFGLNEETRKWIQYASSAHGVDQKTIANFVQMGKAASLSGDTIETMVEQGLAMSRQFQNLNIDSAVEDLTEFYSTGNASGAVLEYLEKVTGDNEIATASYSEKLKALKEHTKGVNEEYEKTDASKVERGLNNMSIAADNLGASLNKLASESGIFDLFSDGMDWIRKQTEGATKALEDFKKASDTAGGGGGGSWGDDGINPPDDSNKPSVKTGKGKPKPLTTFLMSDNARLKEQMSINLAYHNEQVAANKKILAEQRRASEEREREAKRAGDKLAQERERQIQETLAVNEKFMDDYNHTTMSAYDYELSLLDKQYEEYKKHVTDKAALDEWYAEQKQRLLNEYDAQMTAYADMGDRLTSGLTRGLEDFTRTGKLNFKEMSNSIIQDMIRIQIQSSMMSLFGGFSSGGGGLLGGAFNMLFNAKGNAFSNGNVTPFANGGVVNSPTFFPMANGMGLMGEAGAEAIMPLKRTASGDLGVKSTPPVVNVNVQNYGNDNVKVEQQGNDIQVIISQIASSISRGTGELGKAMEGRYGLRKV